MTALFGNNIAQGKDIFQNDFLFLPIHDHLHWSLVIICLPSKFTAADNGLRNGCIIHLDSMEGESPLT